MQSYNKLLQKSLVLLWLGSLTFAQAQQVEPIAPFFLPRVIKAINTYYVLTQGNSQFLQSKFKITQELASDTSITIYEFFPTQGVFKVVAHAPFVRSFYGATCYRDKIIIAGGYDATGKPTNNVFEFDLSTRKWLPRNSRMNFKRADLALEVSGNTIYAIYGDEKGTIEAYDELNGKWIIVPFTFTDGMQPLKKVRGSVAIENNIYLLADEGIFEVINVNTRKILTGVKPPFTSSFYGITEFNRKIYVAAGANKDEFDYNVYLFNTLDNTWKSAGKISVDICGAGLVNHGRMLFFLGGSTTNMFQQTTPTGSIFIYRPMY